MNNFDKFAKLCKIASEANLQKLMQDALKSEDNFIILMDFALENNLIRDPGGMKEAELQGNLIAQTNQMIFSLLYFTKILAEELKVGDYVISSRFWSSAIYKPYSKIIDIKVMLDEAYLDISGIEKNRYVWQLEDGSSDSEREENSIIIPVMQ